MDFLPQSHPQILLHSQKILRVPFPVCSLAEQRRIVAKVDQLMALVDKLEAQLTASRSSSKKLMEAVVGEITNY